MTLAEARDIPLTPDEWLRAKDDEAERVRVRAALRRRRQRLTPEDARLLMALRTLRLEGRAE